MTTGPFTPLMFWFGELTTNAAPVVSLKPCTLSIPRIALCCQRCDRGRPRGNQPLRCPCCDARLSSSWSESPWLRLAHLRRGSNGRSAELVGVAQPIARCGECGGEGRRRKVAERRVRTALVVAGDPAGEHGSCVVEIEVSGIAARHSLVTSSMTFKMRKRRPEPNWSWTKPSDQHALGLASTRIGALMPMALLRPRRQRTDKPSSR